MKIITNLIELIDNELRISHRVIAKETNIDEESISRLIRKHIDDLEKFGSVGFQIQPRKDGNSGGDQPKTYYLNEQQSTLLLTFMRNNEIVIEFKVRLVKEFYRMREDIKSKQQIPEIAYQDFDFDNELKSLEKYEAYSNKMINFLENLRKRNKIDLYRFNNIAKHKNITLLEFFGIDFENEYFIPTELGTMTNRSPIETNKILEARGFQTRENGVWHLTEKGRDFGIEVSNGSYLQLKWKLEVVI